MKRVLILVENLPSPFDRRVWQEAGALRDAGYVVSIICPTGKGYEKKFEAIDGIDIWRYDLPAEAEGALGYLVEYSAALAFTFLFSWKFFSEKALMQAGRHRPAAARGSAHSSRPRPPHRPGSTMIPRRGRLA
jgi:hypothetical protein